MASKRVGGKIGIPAEASGLGGVMRTCIGCRRVADPAELVRVARRPDGTLAVGRTEPGRGAWLCAGPGSGALPKASGSGALPKASGSGVSPKASGSGVSPKASGSGVSPKASGSGAPPKASAACFEAAVRRRAFGRALRCEVKPVEVANLRERLL